MTRQATHEQGRTRKRCGLAFSVAAVNYFLPLRNSVSSKKIPGAEVSVITSQGDTLRTVSDEISVFIFPKMPEGPATIKIEAEGYKTLIQLLDIRANSSGRYFKRFDMEKAEAAANGETDKPKQE